MKVKRKRKRAIEEAAARCVAIVVLYHNSPKSHRVEELFVDDVRSIARWASELAMSERETEQKLFRPLRSELVARYGEELGADLRSGFLRAYRDAWRTERLARRGSSVDLGRASASKQPDLLTERAIR